ncbi:MAG: hypothetical protein ABI411_06390 [Tahibacter sp.]
MAQRSAELPPLPRADDDVVNPDDGTSVAWNSQIDYLLRRQAHWRRPEHDKHRMRIALVVAFVLHLLLLFVLRDQFRWRFPPEDRRDVVQLRLLTLEPARPVHTVEEPPPMVVRPAQTPAKAQGADVPIENPESLSRARAHPATRIVAAPQAPGRTVSLEARALTPLATPVAPRLYGVDGRLLVDADLATRPAAPGPRDFVAPRFVAPLLMQHRTPLPYEATRFDKDWTPDHETRLGEFVRKNTHTVSTRTRWGGQITCTWMLFMGGCGFGYAPPNPEGLKRMRENPPFKPALAPPGTQRVSAPVPDDGSELNPPDASGNEDGDAPPIPAN